MALPDDPIHRLQEAAARRLRTLPSLAPAKLCGGTALARCHLGHRVSYDLDWFLPAPFDPVAFGMQLKRAGFRARALDVVVDDRRANQWHGWLNLEGQDLKVSAVEDAYFDVYPAVEATLGDVPVRTESVEGLYHRKLLTVTHASPDGVTATGGRQTARDLFDLWALSTSVAPLRTFVDTLPYDYPLAAFEDGLDCMPWFDLAPGFQELRVAPEWAAGGDVETVRRHLFGQLGIDVDAEMEAALSRPPPKPPRP